MIVLYILLALLVLLMMVTIHEFGHYVAGKILGFKINEFAIGFGPSLYSHKCKSGEIFSIRLFPLGGYCAFEGEEGGSDNKGKGAFLKQKPWKRLIVLFNGAFFNFISAIIFCFIMLVSVGYDIPKVYSVDSVVRIDSVVYDISEGGHSTAIFEFKENDKIIKINGEEVSKYINQDSVTKEQLASLISIVTKESTSTNGTLTLTVERKDESLPNPVVYYTKQTNKGEGDNYLQKGDVILKVNGTNIDFIKDNYFNKLVQNATKNGDTVELTVKRNGKQVPLTLNLYETGFADSDGNYSKAIGVSSTAYKFTFGESLARCVPYTFGFSWKVLGALGSIITGKVGLSDVGGPIYTIGTIANLSAQSWTYFLTLLPLIAANLAIFNWLPFPALDGSKMVLTTIEWIKGKPLFSQKTENLIHTIGFILLLGLVFIADFYHIIVGIFK